MAEWTLNTPQYLSWVNNSNRIMTVNNTTSNLMTLTGNLVINGTLSTNATNFLQNTSSSLINSLFPVINVFDYMNSTQIADVQNGVGSIDVTSVLQNAINAGVGKRVH